MNKILDNQGFSIFAGEGTKRESRYLNSRADEKELDSCLRRNDPTSLRYEGQAKSKPHACTPPAKPGAIYKRPNRAFNG